MANGQLIGEILEVWRSATSFWHGRERGNEAAGQALPLTRLAGTEAARKGLAAMPRACLARADLLMLGVDSLGVDADEFYARYGLLHHDMEQTCAACCARSRCRRDLATGDFARRYRHYCPNAATLSDFAAGAAQAGRA